MNEQPLPAFHFQVEWGGTRLGFSEVTGLELETRIIEYREGNSKDPQPIKIPGLKKYGNVTLKRGIVQGDNELFEWFITNGIGEAQARDVTISLLDDDHEPVVRWKLRSAWITKITGPTLNASASSIAIEEMTLSCEEISIDHE